jgi:uncharacterized protein
MFADKNELKLPNNSALLVNIFKKKSISKFMSAIIHFEDLKFRKSGEEIRGEFLDHYYFQIDSSELEQIGEYEIKTNGDIEFNCAEKRANQKIQNLIEKGFQNLHNKLRNKKTVYIHENSGIPLIGSGEFGLVDRGTNIIEIKPVTGCNLSCIFCSVGEGINDRRDILVEQEYLLAEFEKLSSIKKHPVEALINPHGEPLLYPNIVELVRNLKKMKNVEIISINTNGCMLSEKLIDELFDAGLTRINLSIHSLDKKRASKLANMPYDVEHVIKMIKYCKGKIDVLLAPVFLPGFNEKDIDDIIELSKTIPNKRFPSIGIQNFLNYKGGRNVAEQMPWENFFEMLKAKEKEHNTKLIVEENLFGIEYDETLDKPFKKGQIIKAEIKTVGRQKNEYIAAAGERNITIINPRKTTGTITIRLLRDKHNIYTAVQV